MESPDVNPRIYGQRIFNHGAESIHWKKDSLRCWENTCKIWRLLTIERWMDKQNVGYTYSSILFSLYKEGSADTCYNVNEPWKHNVKWKKPLTKGQILYGSTYMTYLECSNSWRQKEWWLPGPRGRGIESYLMGTEFQFGMMKQFWRWLVVMVAQQCKCALCHWTVYLEMVKMVNFMLCIFYYNKKE